MPVVVTGASGFIGSRAVSAFTMVSPEVRAYVRNRQSAGALREAGSKIAVGEITDVDRLEVVMAGAHTVCHLVGGLSVPDPSRYEPDIVGSIRAVLEAARRTGVRRFLYLSYPGASPGAANPYLRAKGVAEEAIEDSGLEHVVIRCTHVYGPGGEWLVSMRNQARSRPVVVVGSGRQRLAPVFVEDVAALLAATDDRERVTSGTWGLEGPDRVTADELTDKLAGRRRRKLHVTPRAAAFLGRVTGSGYGLPLLEILAGDSLADAPDAAAEFGLRLTSLDDGLARSV
jgi:NADH dehydrogenase